MAEPSDHDLLILLNVRIVSLVDDSKEVHEQLKRGNDKFVSISLWHQEVGAGLAGLRTDYSRAMERAEAAGRAAQDNDRAILNLKLELDTWKTRVKTVAWLLTPIFLMLSALALEAIRRLLFQP